MMSSNWKTITHNVGRCSRGTTNTNTIDQKKGDIPTFALKYSHDILGILRDWLLSALFQATCPKSPRYCFAFPAPYLSSAPEKDYHPCVESRIADEVVNSLVRPDSTAHGRRSADRYHVQQVNEMVWPHAIREHKHVILRDIACMSYLCDFIIACASQCQGERIII